MLTLPKKAPGQKPGFFSLDESRAKPRNRVFSGFSTFVANMEISLEQFEDITIVHLAGELDGRTSPLVQDRLLPQVKPDGKILLNMTDVTHLSNAGLRTLLLLYRQITYQDGRVLLAGLSETLQDTMSATGFMDFFTTYDTVAAGLAALLHQD